MTSDAPIPETSGRVTAFDPHIGLGQVTTDGEEQVMFHCAEIMDGSRTIEIGQQVRFHVRPKFGRSEAFGIVKV